jgi:hypothetical protein
MTRTLGRTQRWVLAHLQESAANEGVANWFAVSDLARLRFASLNPDKEPLTVIRFDTETLRKAIKGLEERGLVEVGERPRPDKQRPVRPTRPDYRAEDRGSRSRCRALGGEGRHSRRLAVGGPATGACEEAVDEVAEAVRDSGDLITKLIPLCW